MSIVQNKKATHDFFIEERIEAGIALEGWEVKAIRAGRAQLKEGYVIVRGAELYLIEIGLAKGKKQHDKRETEREREWQRERQRLLKQGNKA